MNLCTAAIKELFPTAHKTHLLVEYAYEGTGKTRNLWVTDPIGKPKEVYESV
jgi:hypothetical protein